MCEVRRTTKTGPQIYQRVSHDLLALLVFRSDFDLRADTVIVRLSPAQSNRHPTVAQTTLVDEQLVRPFVCWPHPAETGIDVLIAVVIKICEHDAVSLLDCAEALQHRNVGEAAGAASRLGL